MAADLSVTFTGLKFKNPFLLSSAPPTESDSNIMRAFEAGWGGVVTKTIGLHPVTNVAGPKTKFNRVDPASGAHHDAEAPGLGAALVVELGADLRQGHRLVAAEDREDQAGVSRITSWSRRSWPGPGSDKELRHWQELASGCQDAGADAFELNLSCPHMDRKDMGSNVGKDAGLISTVARAVKEVAKVPVWCKLTPSTTDIVAGGERLVCRRRRRHRVVEHVSVTADRRPGVPRVRDERRRLRVERRARRTGDPAAVARQDGADDAGLPRSCVLRDRGRHGFLAGA